MTRTFFRLVLLLVSSVYTVTASPPLVAFERGPQIYVANLNGTDVKKIAKGSAPDLSPDGTRVAFHTEASSKTKLVRQIAVADIAAKRVTVFKGEIPSENCQRAVWSPGGEHILFEIWTDSDWHLAMINADGSGFRYVKKASPKNNSLWSTCWAPDGRSIYTQNLDKLYQLAPDGSELKQWSLRTLFPKGSLSSGSTIAVSPDGNRLLIDVEMEGESVKATDWDGPPPSMWIFDLASGETSRLTPKGVLAWHGCWLNDKQVLFTSQGAGEKQPSIYEMSVSEKDRKPVIRNANNPTVSR
jgi:TolB protein